jgi:2-isopropylmalate synthase
LNFTVSDEEMNRLFVQFKELADKKKQMTDEDLVALVLEEKATDNIAYELVSFQISHGTNQTATATVSLKKGEAEAVQEAATGAGSVEALYNTIARCLNSEIELKDYRIQSVGAGMDALAQVFVKMNYQGTETSGRGLDQDVLEASAKAYLNAVNRVIIMKELEEKVSN